MLGLADRVSGMRLFFCLSLRESRVGLARALCVGLLFLTVGCEEPTIRETVVPRERSGLDGPEFQLPGGGAAAGNAASSTGGAPRGGGAMGPVSAGERLLIAMIDRPENTYFLRIQAAPTAVDAVRSDFDQILQSLTFSGGRVAWKLPEGWTESEGGAMFRLATLRAPSGVEVFVTSLTAGQDVLANVNRWQGQLNLPTFVAGDTLPIERIQVGPQEVILYDAASAPSGATGASTNTPANGAGGGAGGAPTSGAGASGSRVNAGGPATGAGPTGAGGGVSAGEGRGELPFRFPALAEGWQPLPPSMVASARWERKDERGDLKLEVFKFPTDATFLSMLAIWVERIGAAAPTEETLGTSISAVTVAELPGELVVWPPAAESLPADGKRVMVVRLVHETHAWYIKLEGTATAVSEFEAGFKTFLNETTRL